MRRSVQQRHLPSVAELRAHYSAAAMASQQPQLPRDNKHPRCHRCRSSNPRQVMRHVSSELRAVERCAARSRRLRLLYSSRGTAPCCPRRGTQEAKNGGARYGPTDGRRIAKT
jgi:hypothetical protein